MGKRGGVTPSPLLDPPYLSYLTTPTSHPTSPLPPHTPPHHSHLTPTSPLPPHTPPHHSHLTPPHHSHLTPPHLTPHHSHLTTPTSPLPPHHSHLTTLTSHLTTPTSPPTSPLPPHPPPHHSHLIPSLQFPTYGDVFLCSPHSHVVPCKLPVLCLYSNPDTCTVVVELSDGSVMRYAGTLNYGGHHLDVAFLSPTSQRRQSVALGNQWVSGTVLSC